MPTELPPEFIERADEERRRSLLESGYSQPIVPHPTGTDTGRVYMVREEDYRTLHNALSMWRFVAFIGCGIALFLLGRMFGH